MKAPWKHTVETERRFDSSTGEEKTPWITYWVLDSTGAHIACSSSSNAEKNLRIMAAAPEMLEALRKAVVPLESMGFDIENVKNVIAKAEGK